MALQKEITLQSGIVVNYHRIVSINKITNVSNIIEVASYTTKEKRQEEKEALINSNETNIFIDTNYIETSYDENVTIEQAYEYLKTTDKFKEAEDI